MRVFFAIFLRFLHSTFRLGRGRGFVNIGVTNIWVIELGRIFGKIFKPNTFEIRPRNYQIHPRQTHTKSYHQEILTTVG